MAIELIISLLFIGCVVSFVTLLTCILIYSICESTYDYSHNKHYYNNTA